MITEGKEVLEFDKLDFSPDQLSNLDRMLTNKEDGDKLFIELVPVQKQLHILPISSGIKIVGIDCRKSGKKLLISNFKSPDDRAVVMKRMADTKTPIKVTIEDVQGKLYKDNDEDTDRPGQPPADADDEKPEVFEVNESGVIVNPKQIIVKFPKTYKTACTISFAFSDEWYSGFDIEIGHAGTGSPVSTNQTGFVNLNAALDNASVHIFDFIEAQEKYKYKKQATAAVIKAVDKYLETNKYTKG